MRFAINSFNQINPAFEFSLFYQEILKALIIDWMHDKALDVQDPANSFHQEENWMMNQVWLQSYLAEKKPLGH